MNSTKLTSILNALACYKFLTRLQMARIGIEKYNSAFSKHCTSLIKAKYIGKIDASNFGLGHIYYLTKKGAKYISLENKVSLEVINFCKSIPKLSPQSLNHRTHAINCQIELFLSCKNQDTEILFYDRDIESLGNIKRDSNLIRKTRLIIGVKEYLEPGAIFMLETSFGKKLYCLEYEHKDYTKKSFEKVLKHLKALNQKVASKKYQHQKSHRTLFIFNNRATMDSIIEKTKSISDIENWFLFKHYEEVISDGKFKNSKYESMETKDFISDWLNTKGEFVSIY